MPIYLLPATFVLMDLVDNPGIDLKPGGYCLFVEVKRTRQRRILQPGERCIDALLNRITLNSRFGISQVGGRKLFNLSPHGSCRFNKNP